MFLDNFRRKPRNKVAIWTILSGPFKGRKYVFTPGQLPLGRRVTMLPDGSVMPFVKGFVKQRMTRTYKLTQAKRTRRRQRAATAFRAPVGSPVVVRLRLNLQDTNRRRAKLGLEQVTITVAEV